MQEKKIDLGSKKSSDTLTQGGAVLCQHSFGSGWKIAAPVKVQVPSSFTSAGISSAGAVPRLYQPASVPCASDTRHHSPGPTRRPGRRHVRRPQALLNGRILEPEGSWHKPDSPLLRSPQPQRQGQQGEDPKRHEAVARPLAPWPKQMPSPRQAAPRRAEAAAPGPVQGNVRTSP